MLLFYLSLIAALPFLITAFPQNWDDTVQVDGFVFDGPASGQSNGKQRITTPSTTTTMTSTTLANNLYNTCMDNCPTTFEYNPVCGTDNVDYTNPGGLGCAQRCGKDISFAIAKKFRVNRVECGLALYGENEYQVYVMNIKYLFWNVDGVLSASEPLELAFCNVLRSSK